MLGRYELLMPIAKGGMGNVWAARLKGTRGFRKLVAIKTILRTLERAELEQMLFQEAVLASQIHHPNVAETLELGEHEGTLYLVMELVSGESLRFILREGQAHGGVPLSVSINLIGQICRGLAAAHDLRDENGERVGLVHRDISPPNIMITDAGTVKIVDFGVATTSSAGRDAPGELKGKVSYFAPEQLRGEALDARVDVFATGILLYLLTVGSHPFRSVSEASTIERILSKSPATTPSVLVEDYPDALEQIVMRALHKDREQRFQSITTLLEALENAFPSAFGPRADETTALYLQRLMKERLLERKTTLRSAQEMAERSHSHSAYSLPAVSTTTSMAPIAKSHRGALLGLGGLFTGLAGAALAGTLYLQGLTPSTLQSVDSLSARERPAAAAHGVGPGSPVEGKGGASTASSLLPSPTSAATLVPSGTLRAKRAPTAHANRDDQAEPSAAEPHTEPTTSIARAPSEADPALLESPTHQDALDTNHALQALAPTTAAAPTTVLAPATALAPPPKAVPLTPRLLSSRLGQNQLLSNGASDAARVRLPAGLNRMGETFSAIVNLCVTATGSVSKVNILRSAGPGLDAQISNALSHWRYRPLVEAGQATPFCYVLKYEIGAR